MTTSSEHARSGDGVASLAIGLLAGGAVVATATAIGSLVLDHRLTDVAMVYLLGVVLVAMRFGYASSLITAAASVAAFDFFFTPPYFSFAVTDSRFVLTFGIMFFVAFVIANRTERIRRLASNARERETRTAALYAMSRELAVARSTDEMMGVAYRHLRDVFRCDVVLLLPDGAGALRRAGALEPEADIGLDAIAAADEVYADVAKGGVGWRAVGTAWLVALRASTGAVGVLVARPAGDDPVASREPRELLDTFASQIALAVERARLGEDAQRAQVEVQNERLRNALLSSVSHDLRNPLGVIKGAVTALIDGAGGLTQARRDEYLAAISDETSRLNRLVRNLLSMTSLEAGALRVRNKEWQPIEEVIGVALNRLDEQLGDRDVHVNILPDASLVPFDATLLEQVLVNLVENAIKYTPPSSPITIATRRTADGVEVNVSDLGPGVPAGEEESIFEKFHRAARTGPGMGIGLTICRGIVIAHGGRIWYEPGERGGASFRFVLPFDAVPAPPARSLPEATEDA
jgi:two-component system, OmpR family, sensor histidine kinase KdpD